MANSADPGQMASDLDLHCLQRQGISGFSRTRVKFADWTAHMYGLIEVPNGWWIMPLFSFISLV